MDLMKNLLTLALLAGATFAVAACSGYKTYEQTPYRGRTAGSGVVVSKTMDPSVETRSADPVFRERVRK
jgi:hypothetical protein